MRGIALDSANQGRLRPSFFFCACVAGLLMCSVGSALAQQAVYRCGQEYTNAPADASRCERLASQAVTVIAGTRVQGAATAPSPATSAAAGASSAVASVPQKQRDDMARSIVSTELEQAQRRHADLLAEYRQGEPVRAADELAPKYQERVARLKAAVDRSQRDIDSLQRELARKSTPSSP